MTKDEIKIVAEDVKAILADIIADYEQRTGKTLQPAHIERFILQVYAYREQLMRKSINHAFAQTFPQFADGLALDLCGEQMGCYRLTEQFAETTLRFRVAEQKHDEIVIPQGTVVRATDTLTFVTKTESVISKFASYVDVIGVASIAGNIGNGWEAGRVKTLESRIDYAGTITVSNIDVTDGGVDEESDDDYRKRILLAPEAFTVCGTFDAYNYHARSVSQFINDVTVQRPKAGSVEVTILTKRGVPQPHLLNKVRDYLSADKRRPINDTVIVSPAKKVSYNIVANLELYTSANAVDTKARALKAIQEYLSTNPYTLGVDIVPLNIASTLKVSGVYNVEIVEPVLTEVFDNEWAVCENITLNIVGEANG
ncbi:baseplate assembly protein [Actinobacillus suis]|uniref:baseplate assembly protein n=1 Tax=Actinobacillus suis TaxID=716 RepID=UPI000E30E783|nr:baseplate J/gp47 family protein [Actinobacillus suis]